MDPGASRAPLQVLGEHEALQQFFSGQDVGGVLDSSVAVDTSILEQYLCNDMDPSSFMLPESPPDSNSEACSPPQIPDFGCERGCRSTQPKVFQPATRSASCHFRDQGSAPSSSNPPPRAFSCRFKDGGSAPSLDPLPHQRLHNLGLTNTFIKSGSPPAPLVPPVRLHQDAHLSAEHYLNPESCLKGYTPPTPPSPSLPPSSTYASSITGPVLVPNVLPASDRLLGSTCTVHTCSQDSKKRRRSESEDLSASEPACCEGDGTRSAGTTVNGPGPGSSQLLTWEPYRTEHWSTLLNRSYQTLSSPAFHVNTDKGFNYSTADEAFVCQKKNHFQVTVHIGLAAEPHFVRTPNGPQEV
ncbi:myelin regulatory factor-like protein, partial [Austrofundulus limnaeus]|uniref:Myelin regulatory factor-like protein n=1 Tax=Austrofundulus limnaeus TaxID=52670 RepID=A0A2I4AK45_AUSLI